MAISYVAAGAAASADGTAPTPALPAGLAADDAMVTVFYSREATDGTVSISAGWQEIYNDRSAGGLLGVWTRPYQTGDEAPTFTLTNHAAGDDCIGHIAAWRSARPAQPVSLPGTIGTFASAADIGAITGITVPIGAVVVVVGGKLDDWTSVATLSGDGLTWAEIGETVSIAGSDAGLVWDYAINGASATAVADKTFTVTGGTSQASKGVMFAIAPKDLTRTTRSAPYTSMVSTVRRISRGRR